MMYKKIGLDVDGVVCDFISHCLEINNKLFSHKTYYDIIDFDLHKSFGKNEWETINKIFRDSKSCTKLKLYPGAIRLYSELNKLGEVYFVTSPLYSYPGWCEERLGWLKNNFGCDKNTVIFTSNKNLADVDILIDDAPHNLKRWAQKNKPCIKVCRPWNANYKTQYEASNEDEIIQYATKLT